MAVQSEIFSTEYGVRSFISTKHIATKQHMSVWLQRRSDNIWFQLSTSNYELINNSAVLTQAPNSTIYSQVEIRVADTPDELGSSQSEIAVLAGLYDEIVALNGIKNDITTVAGISGDVTTVSSNILDINSVVTNIVPNLNEILQADTNATIATTKATEASASATSASTSATTATNQATIATTKASEASASATSASNSATTATTKASEASVSATSASNSATSASNSATTATTKANEASASASSALTSANNANTSETMAYKWSSNPVDTIVETDKYSALHWATKAQQWASTVDTTNFVDRTTNQTIGGTKTFSSSPIVPNATTATQPIAYGQAVKNTGDETIAGVKTFSSSPLLPVPENDNECATKGYVDNVVNTNIGQLSTDFYQGPYGFSWDYATDTYIRTGAKGYTSIQSKMKRCVLNVDGSVKYYLHPDNSNFKEDGTPSVLTGADGNVMVEIPKHYIKVETVGNVDSFSISLTQEPGYVLDPSFMKWNGTAIVEVPYRYFRAYEGFVSGGKLLSVSGVTPTRSQTIATFRTQAMANGTGWHLTDWNLLNTIKRLCYIEFCDFIVTKYLGEGNYTGNDYGITTGQSNALGNRSSKSTHNDMYMSYRGIENMYADIWEFVDGININNYQAYINQKWSTFASDVFSGDYVAKGPLIAAGASNSLIKRCNVSVDGGFIPTTIGGSTTTFYGDALWSATGARIAFYGGNANAGASAGLGALSVNYASSSSDVSVGAAVCR